MPMPDSRTLPDLLAEMASRHPDRTFVIDGDHRLSYAGFQAETRILAKGLYALGVRRGDKVAVLMGNRTEWLLTDFAVTMLGATLVAVNTWWKNQELHHALELCDVSVLVMADRYLTHDYVAALDEMGDLGAALPLLRHVVCLGDAGPPGAMNFADLPALGRDVPDAAIEAAQAAVRPDDAAYLLFTSGSTARSKAVTLVHGGLVRNAFGIGERLHLTGQDRLLLVVSLFWSFACANGLLAVMTHGGSVVLSDKFDAAETIALLARERCTLFYTMPNMALALHGHPDRARHDLSSLRTGICLPQALAPMIDIGAREMTVCYGLTECYGNSAVVDCRAPLATRTRITGMALPDTELEIVDPATRLLLPVGEMGEIRLRGFVTPGYYKDPERTAEAIDAEGWFYTGDLAALEPDGGVLFRGRLKEMVKTGGINVAPAEVEELLQAHPAVRQAIVVGIPDPERDEVLAAMVVPEPGARVDVEELMRFCRARAAIYKVPRRIVLVRSDEVPLTDTGKVAKRRIQEVLATAEPQGKRPMSSIA